MSEVSSFFDSLPEKVRNAFPAEIQKEIIKFRCDVHENPELSHQEFETRKRIIRQLKAWDIGNIHLVGETGLIAKIPGEDPTAPIYAVRGDIDALPIQENTGLPFASTNDGIMHACGHDVHTTWALAAAYLFKTRPAKGDVWVLFQPAEETATGAKAVLETGALDGVQAIFGAHVDRQYPIGKVVVKPGPIASFSDAFSIVVTGSACHAARPEEGKNPLQPLGRIIESIETVQNEFSEKPENLVIVSPTQLVGGDRANMIPETASCSGTIRCMQAETREKLLKRLEQWAQDIAADYGCTAELQLTPRSPGIFNQSPFIDTAREVVTDLLGPDAAIGLFKPNLASEDFGYYLQEMGGGFLRVGARYPQDDFGPVHHPKFFAEHDCIFVGAVVLAEWVRRL